MKRALLVILLIAATAQAIEPTATKHKWLRRIGAIAVCAAGAFDTATTFHAASIDAWGTERTPFLRDANKRPSPWRFAVVKGAMCGGAIWMAESKRVNETAALSAAGAMATPDIMMSFHNLGIKPTPGAPKR
jgi:hypothetical protein